MKNLNKILILFAAAILLSATAHAQEEKSVADLREEIQNMNLTSGEKYYQVADMRSKTILMLFEMPRENVSSDVKQFVFSVKDFLDTFEEAYKEPLNYLTHLNRNVSSEEMIDRFYSNRKLALLLIPEMKFNLKNRFKNLPSDILETEMQALEWYESKGWKLWLF